MQDSQKKQAWITSLRLLAATPKSSHELARKLAEKGYASGVVDDTIRELQEKGILNDAAYTQNLLVRFLQAQPSGRRKIDFELKRRGIPAKIRQDVLSNLSPEEEMSRARELGLLKWGRLSNLPLEKRKKKIYDLLLRRGFDYQITREFIEELEGIGSE